MREYDSSVMTEPRVTPPRADVPSLSVRWEGLVVVLDETTLNTLLRRATQRVPEIREISAELEDGRLGLSVQVKKGVRVRFHSRVTNIRWKDGWLGFTIEHLTMFGFVPIPNWVLRKLVARQKKGFAFFYPEDRVVVLNLTSLLPAELSLQVREVICDGGEIRAVFGPSHYRLDRLLEILEEDPFRMD